MFKYLFTEQGFIELISSLIALSVVITVHEFSHAFTAVKCGDLTPKVYGRYSLNPLRHFDPIGFLMLFLVHFGWAKPVPINPNNFHNRKRGMILVSSAGVIANYIGAFICYPLFLLAIRFLPNIMLFDDIIKYTLLYCLQINLALFVFNLIPIYPLDGFNLVFSISSSRGRVYKFLRYKGYFVFLIVMVISLIAESLSDVNQIFAYFDIFGKFMSFCINIIGWHIIKIWSIIF